MKDVTIVIPTYNEEKHIEQAILSAIHQAEFVIVSDNCSTDKTPNICKELAKEYKNLIFYEQKQNNGAMKNFEFLFSKVKTKYVMSMGGHDYLESNYIKVLKKCLEKNLDIVMAYSPAIDVDDNNKVLKEEMLDNIKKGFFSNNILERIYTAITMEYNYTFLGLFRSEIFIRNADFSNKAGIDHHIVAKCAKDGKFMLCLDTRFYLRVPSREETAEAYMKRLSGKINELDMSYTCMKQLDLLNSIDSSILNKKDFFFNDAKEFLQKKYGKYCKEYAQNLLKKIAKSDSKYILYGAGTDAHRIITILKDKILFIVDKDINKQGQNIDNIKIYSVENIKKYKNIQIIISQIGRFDIISSELIKEYKIDKSKFVSLDIIQFTERLLNETR